MPPRYRVDLTALEARAVRDAIAKYADHYDAVGSKVTYPPKPGEHSISNKVAAIRVSEKIERALTVKGVQP